MTQMNEKPMQLNRPFSLLELKRTPQSSINQSIVVAGGHVRTQPTADDEIKAQIEAVSHREEIKKENLALCCQIVIFIAFLLFFTCAMLLEQSESSSRFADHVRSMLAGGGPNHHAIMALDRIGNTDDMYNFLEQTFIPALWENNTDTNQAMAMTNRLHPIDTSNRLLGSARIRQVRVQNTPDCQTGPMFETYKIPCYPIFMPDGVFGTGNADKEAYGPEGRFTYSNDDLGNGYSGSLGVYPSGGYMEYLATNVTLAQITLQALRNDNFFDYATRAVFVDFTVWNSNMGAYAVGRVAVEFGPAATSAKYLEVSVLREQALAANGSGSGKDWIAFFFLLIVMCFVIYYLAEEIQEIVQHRFMYFLDGWNVMDWINMILLIIAFIVKVLVWSDASGMEIGAAQIANKDSFANIRGLANKAEMVRLLYSFNAVLLWGKCVKYARHLPIVKVLVKTVWNAFSLFLPFMLMFGVAFIGFTMAYNIGFGDKLQELTTFTRASVYLCRVFLKDITLMPLYHITPIFGACLILLFYVMIVLVGVNVLFAIMADAMFRAKCHPEEMEPDPEHHDEPLEELLRVLKEGIKKCAKKACPRLNKKVKDMVAKQTQKVREMAAMAIGKGQEENKDNMEKMALKDGVMSESSYTTSSHHHQESTCTFEQMMLAIQHMAGRVLSEVQEVGIEIKSELHDVCERVAQMQMAVEELSWRAELVRREQEEIPGIAPEGEDTNNVARTM
mmetsp:Transcript_48745/g.77657  ORF Transcript_48745/g.77657 Transcript_48745/m.77657 type:complete len:730 (+) Transcript_48745:98-2287(+)|eukprot:CAMPEP_0169085452 /NCGR_PEP_ID=MMETSP1015-20121227/13167_1 /TAXON_ID=342587 /ORGANISM="Karlodinium micrum, Strain CCMP2283" /LENGTH=729 /DNA_ID=CAMNT_0009145539 /DNA_START=88 /DNA_END=2277 /DNA_ORIENTATION=-